MRSGLLFSAALLIGFDLNAQSTPVPPAQAVPTNYHISLEASPLSSAARGDIYVAGNFNGWNPRDESSRMIARGDGRYHLDIVNAPLSSIEFAFTRGSWRSQETSSDGSSFPVHRIEAERNGAAAGFIVEHWRDDFPGLATTASPGVRQLGTFHSPQLNRNRRVWIYTPAGYEESDRRYPVLYMHDGQSVFDQAISGNFDSTTMTPGEWEIDEAADAGELPLIVVAIENGGSSSRWIEYVPFDTAARGRGEGREYLGFIVDTIKPHVDAHYRTAPDRENTYIAGSSLGGLISFYAGLYYPDVFGKVGSLSPSFWYAHDIYRDIDAAAVRPGPRPKYYFYFGEQELDRTRMDVPGADVLRVRDSMRGHGWEVDLSVNPDGLHRVRYWRDESPRLLNWFLSK